MNVPFLVSNILSGVGMCAMLASTALRSRRKILAVQSVNHALSMAACSLLRGWSGAVQEAVNLVRDLAILLFGKLNRFWQIFFVAAALGLGAAVTFAGGFQWYGLLPVLATALYSAVIVHPRCNARAGDVLCNDGRLGGTGHAAPQPADEPEVKHDVQPRRHRQEHQRHDRVAQRPQQRRKIIIEKCRSQPHKHDAQVRPHHGVDLGRDAQEPNNAVEPGVHSKHQHRRDTRQQHKAGKDALF